MLTDYEVKALVTLRDQLLWVACDIWNSPLSTEGGQVRVATRAGALIVALAKGSLPFGVGVSLKVRQMAQWQMGHYDDAQSAIVMNSSLLDADDPAETVDTVAHEFVHCLQCRLHHQEMRLLLAGYESPKPGCSREVLERYVNNPAEVEARTIAHSISGWNDDEDG